MAQSQISRGSYPLPPRPPHHHSRPHSNRPPSRPSSQPTAPYSSNGMPVGYPGATNGHRSMSPRNSGHYGRATGMSGRSPSRSSLQRQSRSLGASKASFVSQRSGKSSIQQEYHDKRVRGNLLSPYYGKGRTPFLISVALIIIGCLFIIAGAVIFGLRFHNNIMLTVDKGEIVGPVLVAFGVLCFGGALKFYYDAYKISSMERRKLKFSAANESMITVSTVSGHQKKQSREALVSGTHSVNAVTRTPQGSRQTMTQV